MGGLQAAWRGSLVIHHRFLLPLGTLTLQGDCSWILCFLNVLAAFVYYLVEIQRNLNSSFINFYRAMPCLNLILKDPGSEVRSHISMFLPRFLNQVYIGKKKGKGEDFRKTGNV